MTKLGILFIPTSRNFSELAVNSSDELEDSSEFVAGDDGQAAADMMSKIEADDILLNLLSHFTDRQKIILLYQLMRDLGYELTHEDCAKTLSLTREHYMTLLKEVKKKAQKIIQLSPT